MTTSTTKTNKYTAVNYLLYLLSKRDYSEQELKLKGVKDWLINQELENAEVDWFELAEQIFEKKRPLVWDLKAKQKMWRFMVSRGFYNDHFSHLMALDYSSDEYE
ncbi:TPA: regulatory protein RecX [Mannheimia haemolytica]|nr:regulatory protein RecX [Mannheimia haemolytica]